VIFAATARAVFFLHNENKVARYAVDDAIITDLCGYNRGVIVATSDGCAYLWDPAQAHPILVLRADPIIGREGRLFVRAVDSERFVTVREDGGIILWNSVTEKLVFESELSVTGHITALSVFEQTITATCIDGTVVQLDLSQPEKTRTVRTGQVSGGVCSSAEGVFLQDENGKWFTLGSLEEVGTGFKLEQSMFGIQRDDRFVITNASKQEIAELTVDGVSACRAHSTQPYFAVGTQDGTVIVEKLGLNTV
jgi:WD40 repeat protein